MWNSEKRTGCRVWAGDEEIPGAPHDVIALPTDRRNCTPAPFFPYRPLPNQLGLIKERGERSGSVKTENPPFQSAGPANAPDEINKKRNTTG